MFSAKSTSSDFPENDFPYIHMFFTFFKSCKSLAEFVPISDLLSEFVIFCQSESVISKFLKDMKLKRPLELPRKRETLLGVILRCLLIPSSLFPVIINQVLPRVHLVLRMKHLQDFTMRSVVWNRPRHNAVCLLESSLPQ